MVNSETRADAPRGIGNNDATGVTMMNARIALVTGVSRPNGIGAAICKALVQKSFHVVFTHWTAFDQACGYDLGGGPDAILAELRALGGIDALAWDLSGRGSAGPLLEAVEQQIGLPQVLINNAAYWAPSSFRDLTEDLLEAHIAVNVRAPLMLSAEFLRRQQAGGYGRIVSLVSGNDHSGEVNNLAYGSTKGAISAMTRYLALEAAPLGVTVNAIDPGPTDTGWMDQETRHEVLQLSPMGRLGQPRDAARLAAFLVSDEAAWITGQIIRSDGGFPH